MSEHEGHRQRMRDRFLQNGLEGFADHEALELLLFYAIPRRNVNPLAHRLLNQFGSLHEVMRASEAELMQVEGIGENAAMLIALAAAVMRRAQLKRDGPHEVLSTRAQAQQHCIRLLSDLKSEHFYLVCMDNQMRLIRDVLIDRGTLGEVAAYPRLVAQAVLRHNAYMVVLCHNHPSGSAVPSQRDVETTRQLCTMLESMGVAVADHVIVAGDRALSMAQSGLIRHMTTHDGTHAQVADASGEQRIRRQLEIQEEENGK